MLLKSKALVCSRKFHKARSKKSAPEAVVALSVMPLTTEISEKSPKPFNITRIKISTLRNTLPRYKADENTSYLIQVLKLKQ